MVSRKDLAKMGEELKVELKKLVGLISQNKDLNEICSEMGVNRETIYYYIAELNTLGYVIDIHYDFYGNIRYSFGLREKQKKDPKLFSLKIPEHIKEFKLGHLSDIHCKDRDDLSTIISICELFQKERINIVTISGDLLHGISSFRKEPYDLFEDMKWFVHNFPHFDNMIFVVVLGNHDYDLFEALKIDFGQFLSVTRHDFVCLGFDYGFIGLQDDMILLQHPKNPKENNDNFELPDSPYLPKTILRIKGHHHCFNVANNGLIMDVSSPATSEVKINGSTMPGFLISECKRSQHNIESICLKNFIIYDGKLCYDAVGTATQYVNNYETNIANQRKREEKKKK